MQKEVIEKLVIHNNHAIPVDEADFNYNKPSIYEVLRVVDSVPLFLEKHMARLSASARFLGFSIDSLIVEIERNIIKLIQINDSPEKNVKLVVYNLQQEKPDYFIYFIESYYPENIQYQEGVKTILFHAQRNNPNAKVINLSLKEQVTSALHEAGAYEALLVNENDYVTEGSRSNLFSVKGGKVFTSPGSSVLIGITRTYIFDICNRLNIEVVEQPISTNWLLQADGLFLTGTSPKILPISEVNQTHYSSSQNSVIMQLINAYEQDISAYVKNFCVNSFTGA